MIHEEVLYQVYLPLPLRTLPLSYHVVDVCVCVCVCGFADRLAEMRTQLQQYQGKVTDMCKT